MLKEVTPQGTVTVNKVVTPPSGSAGTVFTYSIVVDPGLSTVTNVVVTDRIPTQLTNAQLLTPFGGEWLNQPAAAAAAGPLTRTVLAAQNVNDLCMPLAFRAANDTACGMHCVSRTAAQYMHQRSPVPPQLLLSIMSTITAAISLPVALAGECAITTAARRAATPAAPAPPPARRNARRNNNNPLGNVIDAIRGGGGGSTPVGAPVTSAAQQTLRCTFASLSSRREIRYTAVGSIVGTWTNLVTVQAPGETPKNDSVPVIIVSSCEYNAPWCWRGVTLAAADVACTAVQACPLQLCPLLLCISSSCRWLHKHLMEYLHAHAISLQAAFG